MFCENYYSKHIFLPRKSLNAVMLAHFCRFDIKGLFKRNMNIYVQRFAYDFVLNVCADTQVVSTFIQLGFKQNVF